MKEHITDGTPCWCNPEMTYKDPINGAEVLVHKELQMTKEEIIEACKNSLNIYSFTAEALEKLMEAVRVEAPVRTKDLTDDEIVSVLEYYDHEWDETTFAIARAVIDKFKAKQQQ